MTVLLLIRHASNDYLNEDRLAGLIQGVHLNAQGRGEADALAQRLAHLAIRAIYASPLERALETAQAVAQAQKLDVQIHPDLIEVNVGEWANKTINELKETAAWKQMLAQPTAFQFPGGDSFGQVHARIVRGLDAIVTAHPEQIVAIVSHADPIKIALAHYLKMDLNQFNRLRVDPAAVSVLLFGEHGPVLSRLNDTGALPSFESEQKQNDQRKEEG